MWSLAVQLDFLHTVRVVLGRWFRGEDLPPGGTGAHGPAHHVTTATLPRHTIFAPCQLDSSSATKYPVVVWGNGGGLAWSLMFGVFLRELASHGYIVVANGDARGWRTLLHQMGPEEGLLAAVEWARAKPLGPTDIRTHVDADCIALAGQSLGGVHAYLAAAALRARAGVDGEDEVYIRTIGLFNSGMFTRRARDVAAVTGVSAKTPVFFFNGGRRDIAHKWGECDWDRIPEAVPVWLGNLDVGHAGTFYDPDGGRFAAAAVAWLDAVLKGDAGARERLLDVAATGRDGWVVRCRNL